MEKDAAFPDPVVYLFIHSLRLPT